ncbi:MAG: hypothetical protein IJ537_11160 [Bacteroidaceae bacterium]|nr:hypothetical protein [Bacteroidaceae bacterium]
MNEDINDLLARYMEGETTQEEQRLIAEYFRATDPLPNEMKPYKQMFDLIGERPEVPTAKALERFAKGQDPSKPPLKGEASFAARFSSFKGELERVLVRRVLLLAAACIAAFVFILLMPQKADENLAIAYIDGKELADQTLAMQMGQEALAEIFSNGNQEQQLTELFNEP